MQQNQALDILKTGTNVFLTGSAGAGKTYVLNQYINYLKVRKIAVAVTASTGIAATHMNGMTIHSWSGIGIKDKLDRASLVRMGSKQYLQKSIERTKVLIIDEISMLHGRQLNLVDQVLQFFKNTTAPFGGIQVVFAGDFFQLPPIGNQGEKSSEKFAFMSRAWNAAKPTICYLTSQHRQEDNRLNQILNEIRASQVSKQSYAQLLEAKNQEIDKDIEPTILYTHNADVDKINIEKLIGLDGKIHNFKGTAKGNPKLIESLKNAVMAAENIQLKLGAKVMFVKNNPEKGYVNGSLGKVIGFSEGKPKVELNNGRKILVEEEEWSIQDDQGKKLARFEQLPLRLAWAITVHKSQGMTLDAAQIDLGNTFEAGQGYVALSRLKKLSHLVLDNFNEMALKMDPLATKADLRFQELSAIAEKKFTPKKIEKEAEAFIKESGGIVDKSEVEKRKARLREGKSLSSKSSKKPSTHAITYEYMRQKMTLSEIAKERGLTVNTIATHLKKIKENHPEENFSLYKPKKSIIEKVKIALENIKGEKSLKAIYDANQGKISYMDIKLAMAFID